MKMLLIGSGGREHAILWSLMNTATQPLELFCAPGNGGIGDIATLVPIAVDDFESLAKFARSNEIDLTFIGPEAPLAAGVVDYFENEGLVVVGPNQLAARLEGSKAFAKKFMLENRVPTARYRIASSPDEALSILKTGEFGSKENPVVVKADGLAAGKGVVVAESRAEAERAVEDLMVNHVAGKDAASKIVLEEVLEGPEVSVLAFVDGRDYRLMPAARDHKRIGENDTGPNTGGMGTITDRGLLTEETLTVVTGKIIEPTLEGCRRDGCDFKGILFLGLMLTKDGPQLLEYNVRFGDPETQAILIRLQTDLRSIFVAMHEGTLGKLQVEWLPGSSACVVAANKGYPAKYESGNLIEGLQDVAEGVQVFHAGTSRSADGRYRATGGRVIGVTAAAATLPEALDRCYRAMGTIHWPGMQFRRDIGKTVVS